MITRSSIAFEDFLGSSIAPQVMPPCSSVSTKKEWFSAHWPNGLGTVRKRDDGLLFTDQFFIIAPAVRQRQTQLDHSVVGIWGENCVQNLDRNIGHWPCFPIPYFTCVRVFMHGGLRLIWIWCGIPKGGKASPNRPWAICLSVWYEDRSGPVFDPRSDTEERRHKRKVGWAEHRGFITKEFMPSEARMKIPSPQLAHEFFCDMWNA